MGAVEAERRIGRRAWTRDDTRYALHLVLLAVVYYVAAKLSLRLAVVGRNVTPLWPPTGIAFVAFLVFGRRMWPAIALGAFLVNLPITPNALAAVVTAAGNTLAPLLAATLVHAVGFRRQIDRWRDAFAIVFLGALLAMTVSATIGTTTLLVTNQIQSSHYLTTWAVWWTGDAMGVLVVAPFLLVLPDLVRWRPRAAEWVEWVVTLLVIGLVAVGVTSSEVRMLSVVIPLLVWTAWRFQLRGAAPAALIAAGIA